MPEMIGALLNDRYRLEAELGQGGMGVVYRAHDSLLDRDVAVKVLSESAPDTESGVQFLREARAAATLNHPNIVTVHDVGEADSLPFIVMELVEGPSLHEQPPTGHERILIVAQQICAALQHAHAHGVIHRDLKPENVLITTSGSAKLVDFGLARSVASRTTTEGVIVGTVLYLAPELALGEEFDGRADLYALGVMLYELTTGELPFTAADAFAVISQHLYAPVVPPRARNPDIPVTLDRLIVQLLSKTPSERPASATEVQEALARLERGKAIRGAPLEGESELSVLDRIVRGRLVAREGELAQARAVWRKAAAGEGQVLLVSGEPGIGKTRLVRELMAQVRVSGSTALLGECFTEGGAPYAPFGQILRRTFHDGAGEGLSSLPDFVMADLLVLAPALRHSFPDVPPNPPLDPQSEQQRLFENVVAFCQALCASAPLLLVLEDAHWADSGSLALLRHLARRTRRLPILPVATYREMELDSARPFHEVLVDLNRERLATRLKLSRLNKDGTRDMLAALFAEEITPEFLAGVYAETEGNPFFIEEVCRALVESGELYFADGRWHRPSMEELQIPQSVRVAIQSRLGKLPARCQETLRLAAVLGREFEFEILAHAGDLQEEALIDALECAGRAQVIEEVSAEQDVTFAFTHGLIPATLTEGMSTLRRRRLHRRAAAAINMLYPDNYETLAYHYGEAGDEAQALIYYTRAGERASAAYANAEAEGQFRAAMELVEDEGEQARLMSELGIVQARLGRYEKAIETWREAIGVYQELEEQDGMAELHARAARAAWDAGGHARGLALCREGMAAVAGAPATLGMAHLLHETARACYFNGVPDEAAALCRQALVMAERLGIEKVRVDVLTTQAVLPGQSLEETIAALTSAVEIAESAELLLQAGRAHQNLGYWLGWYIGDFRAAQEHFRRVAELDRQRGDVEGELFSTSSAIAMLMSQGAFSEAREELSSLRRLLDDIHDPGKGVSNLHGNEAMLLRYRGDLAEAVKRLRSLRKEALAAGDLQGLSATDAELGEALWEFGKEEEAQAVLLEAIAIGEQGLFPPIVLYCELSMCHSRRGDIGAAQGLLSKALDADSMLGASMLHDGYLSLAEAHLAVAEGEWSQAWDNFDSTATSWARIGYRWYRARALREWAEAHLTCGKPGDRERARELLREAEAEFENMGVSYYAAQARALLEELES
jgi:tetratricopeptide (TPR) repeat protein